MGEDGLIKTFDINTECYLNEIDIKEEITSIALDPIDDKNVLLGKPYCYCIDFRFIRKCENRSFIRKN